MIAFVLFILSGIVGFYFFFKFYSIEAKYDIDNLKMKEIKKLNNPDLLREYKKNRRNLYFYTYLFLILALIAIILGLP